MSPEIRKNGILIADTPDETGWHKTLAGRPIYVNVDLIDAEQRRQPVVIMSEEIADLRVIGLKLDGTGSSTDPKRGDGKRPEVSVKLHDRPIRVAYSERVVDVYAGQVYYEPRQTRKNPRWVRGHGQR